MKSLKSLPSGSPKPPFLRAAAGVLAALLLAGSLTACDDATSTEDFLSRAEDYRDKGDLKASTIELKNALQQDPRNADARWLLGLNHLDMGLVFAAEIELKREQSVDDVDIIGGERRPDLRAAGRRRPERKSKIRSLADWQTGLVEPALKSESGRERLCGRPQGARQNGDRCD